MGFTGGQKFGMSFLLCVHGRRETLTGVL